MSTKTSLFFYKFNTPIGEGDVHVYYDFIDNLIKVDIDFNKTSIRAILDDESVSELRKEYESVYPLFPWKK
jgi:hypothetical protein